MAATDGGPPSGPAGAGTGSAGASSAPPAVPEEMRITLRFANFDNGTLAMAVMTIRTSISVPDLKRLILKDAWPASYQRPANDDAPANILLFVMGKPLLNTSAVAAMPRYEWPTPIHVALRAGAPPEDDAAPGPPKVVFTSAPPQSGDGDDRCCCTVQ